MLGRAYDNFAPELDKLRREVHGNFLRACESLYWINPRSNIDPETGLATSTEGLQRVKLYPEQRLQVDLMLDMQRRNKPVRIVKLKCRQSGDSTLAELWTFHHMYWGRRRRALTVAHHDSTTSALYQMAQTLYAELPPELQWQQRRLNRKEMSFEAPSGSSLVAQTAGYLDIGHGLTLNDVHLSEIDRWPDPSVALEGIMETMPFAPGTSMIIESVAQDADGWLAKFWRASKNGQSGFYPMFTPAYKIPEYRLPVPDDFELSDEEREWVREYRCSFAFIMWYRAKKATFLSREPWGGERRMKAMYPFTDEEAFQSMGFCVFPDSVLAKQRENVAQPIESVKLYPVGMGEFKPEKCPYDYEGALWIWEKPEAGALYSLGVDVSDGVGLSESVVTVCKYPGYEQVAEWASKESSVEHTAWVARWMAELYGGANCMIIPEINKSGILVLYLLQNLPGNYGIFRWRYLDRPGQQVTDQPKLGWDTNDATKKILVQVANLIFMSGGGVVRSPVLQEQMTRCVDVLRGNSLAWGVKGKHSDRVLAWLIAMTGAYLEFEGGTVGGIGALQEDVNEKKGPKRELNSYDADWERDLGGREPAWGGIYSRGDTMR